MAAQMAQATTTQMTTGQMATDTAKEVMGKVEASRSFRKSMVDINSQASQIVANRTAPPAELRKALGNIRDQLSGMWELYNQKGKRRMPVGGYVNSSRINMGLCQPIVVHPVLREFVKKAQNLGYSNPYNYEYSKAKDFKDLQGRAHEFRLTTESGATLWGPDVYGKGVANKPSKTNQPLAEILKCIDKGITSSAELNSLFSCYMIDRKSVV